MSVSTECNRMLGQLQLTQGQRERVDNRISFRKERCGLTASRTQEVLKTVIALQNAGVLGSETITTALLAQLEAQVHSAQPTPPAKI